MQRSPADWLAPLRTRNLIPDDTLAAYVVGSAARGWANARSDFDIYVITTSTRASETSGSYSLVLDPPHVHNETFHEQTQRWEVTFWQECQLDQMLAKVSWAAYERGTAASDVLALREEVMLSQFVHCLPLLGEEMIERYRERLAASAFRSFLVVRSLGAADDAVEDALGQMESGALESATISARTAIGHAVDALLESEGEYGSHIQKWRPNRFRTAAPQALSFEDYWKLETMRDYDPADPRPWIKNVLMICQDIAMQVETS